MKVFTAIVLIVLALIVMVIANAAIFLSSPGDSLWPQTIVMDVCEGVIFLSSVYLIIWFAIALGKDQDRRYGK